MGLFSNGRGYDRARILDAAARARTRRRRRTAIRLYRRVLAVEPGNAELHARIAPLLAETGQAFDAWQSYHQAGRALVRANQLEKAIATYREAAKKLPRQIEAWLQAARIEHKLGRNRDAVRTLLEGRRRFRGRGRRAEAIHLLRLALQISEWDVPVTRELSRLLARADQKAEAQELLERLAERADGADLRRVRATQWRIEPSLRHTWLLLRAVASPA